MLRAAPCEGAASVMIEKVGSKRERSDPSPLFNPCKTL